MTSPKETYKHLQNEFAEILQTTFTVEPEPDPTFLQISEFPHYEEVISNWYAFFFKSHEKHKLKTLFADSLCQLITEKGGHTITLNNCDVIRERTVAGKRIDLLLFDQSDGEGEKQTYRNAIVVENKINAAVYNDLKLYYKNITADENKAAVVLSLKPETDLPNTYVNITHTELATRIAQNLGSYLLKANDRYLLFLKDFLQQLQSFTITENMKELIRFYYENAAKINELTTIKNKAIDTLFAEIGLALAPTDFRKGRRYADALNMRFEPMSKFLLQLKVDNLFDNHCYEINLWLTQEHAKAWSSSEPLRQRIFTHVTPTQKFTYNTDKTGTQWAWVGKQAVQLENNFTEIENLSQTIATDLQTNWQPFLTALAAELNTPAQS